MRYCWVLVLLLLCGCLAIPEELEDSVHTMHKGNIIICEDYVKLATVTYEGGELEDKLNTVKLHLEHSSQLDKYVKGKGGKFLWPWSSWKESE
jgi:hypothetical protein